MADWSAEELANAIERRRGRPRRASGIVRKQAETGRGEWSERDWINQFRLTHGGQARLRGVTQVCVRDTDGAIMWEGGVREFDRNVGERVGYGWFMRVRDTLRFRSVEHGGVIRCAEDAVRSQL